MLTPAAYTNVTAAFPVVADTPFGQVVALLGKFLADTKSVCDAAYGIGQRVPPFSEVPWRLEVRNGAEVIVFTAQLKLPDGGALFRAEMDRRGKVAEMLARVAAAPMGPA